MAAAFQTSLNQSLVSDSGYVGRFPGSGIPCSLRPTGGPLRPLRPLDPSGVLQRCSPFSAMTCEDERSGRWARLMLRTAATAADGRARSARRAFCSAARVTPWVLVQPENKRTARRNSTAICSRGCRVSKCQEQARRPSDRERDGRRRRIGFSSAIATSDCEGRMKPAVRGSEAPAKTNERGNVRTGLDAEAIGQALIDNLHCLQAKAPQHATRNDWYMALAYTARDRLLDRYIRTVEAIAVPQTASKVVAYLSAEFLTGPHLGNSLLALGIWEAAEQALSRVGQSLSDILDQEEEPGLGNGGLGRLAACYMDSLATLNVPAIGYGIRYEFGIFDQAIRDGWQVELTDKWLRFGNPWEIVRSEVAFNVKLGGHTEHYRDQQGKYRVRWHPERMVRGIAYDTPIPGYQGPTTNLLRLWKAEAAESFDFEAFNVGDYYGAVDQKVESETISKVLYPNDEPVAGKQLRLAQQFFFVSCSLQDMIRLHLQRRQPLDEFDSCWAAQLNDTHPSIAVAELMRLLVDEHLMDWDQAWTITERTCGYTNHTLL